MLDAEAAKISKNTYDLVPHGALDINHIKFLNMLNIKHSSHLKYFVSYFQTKIF